MADLRRTFKGYLYQDLATAIQFSRALLGDAERIVVDRKLHSPDVFDDLSVWAHGRLVRRQFKHSENPSRRFEPEDLRTGRADLRIDNLCRSLLAAGVNLADEYRICACWGQPTEPTLTALLLPVSTAGTFPGHTTRLYRLNADRLWPTGGEPYWPVRQRNSLSRTDYVQLCDRLLIEVECPQMSGDLRTPGPAEAALIALLSDEIGIGRFPNQHLNALDTAARLIYEATAARGAVRDIGPDDIKSMLRLRTDYGRVAQRFPVRYNEAIEFAGLRAELRAAAHRSNRVLVVGPPGSGKSWLLTALGDELRTDDVAVGRHYCYIAINDSDAPKRILTETLYANPTATLVDAVPAFERLNRPLYASGPAEFHSLLHRAAAEKPDVRIILIIDGLDHIARIRSLNPQVSPAASDIVTELAALDLPTNTCLIVGSQPGDHLSALARNTDTLAMPPWDVTESRRFSDRSGFSDLLSQAGYGEEIDQIVSLLRERSAGNPLYTWYLAKDVRLALSREDARSPQELLAAAPPYDEHLNEYYAHLIRSADASSEMIAQVLACIDFGLTKEQIAEIGGPWLSPLVDRAVEGLRPVWDEAATRGGIKIYHESFRRFMLARVGGGEAVGRVLEPVIRWLFGRGFPNDAMAYRFLMPCLRRASRHREIVSLVHPRFVSDGIASGHSNDAVHANVREMSWAAVRVSNWPALAACAELHKAIWTAYEDFLQHQSQEYGKAFAAVHGGNALAERLLFDGRPTFSRDTGLLLCRICDIHGAGAPWAEYQRLGRQSSGNSGWEPAAIAEFVAQLRLRGLKAMEPTLLRFLSSREARSPAYLQGILHELYRIEGTAGLTRLLRARLRNAETAAAVYLALASAYQSDGRPEDQRAYADLAARANPVPGVIRDAVDLGLPVAVLTELVRTGQRLAPVGPPVVAHPQAGDGHPEWIALMRIHALLSGRALAEIRASIAGPGWYPAWLRFVIDLAQAEAKLPHEPSTASDLVVRALELLATFDRPFEGKPRAADLYSLHGLIEETFRRALRVTGEPEQWRRAVASLSQISRATMTHIQGERGFTGPLSSEAFSSLLLDYAVHPILGQDATNRIASIAHEVERKGEYYSVVATHQLILAEAYGRRGDRRAARTAWELAARAMCGYGWRKDVTIWEAFQTVPDLANADSSRARYILSDVQALVDSVLFHTDGRETKNAPNAWFQALVDTDPTHAAIILGRSLSADGGTWHWRWEEALDDLLEAIWGHGDPIVTFLLHASRPWEVRGTRRNRLPELVQRTAREQPDFLPSALRLADPKVANDGDRTDLQTRQELLDIAQGAGVPLLDDVYIVEPREAGSTNPAGDSDLWVRGAAEFALEEPRFPVNASPLQILVSLRRSSSEYRSDRGSVESVIAPLGFRLVELLQMGDRDNVERILSYFGSEWHYSGGGRALADLAAGLERHGYPEPAAYAYALAHRYTQTDESLRHFARSIELDRNVVKVIPEEYAVMLEEPLSIRGVPSQLIKLSLQLNDGDTAFEILRSATDVIGERLFGSTRGAEVFSRYSPDEMPGSSLDEALAYVLVSRLAHPENERRHAALAAVCELIRLDHPAVRWGIGQHLSNDCLNTTAICLLEAVWLYEQAPFPTSTFLEPILQEAVSTDVYGVGRLAKRLLLRAGVRPRQSAGLARFGVTPPITERRKDAILSIDAADRLSIVERVWPGCVDVFAGEFERCFSANERNQDRMRRRWEVARDRLQLSRPPKQCHLWEGEIFETTFQRLLSQLPVQMFKRGTWDETAEERVLELSTSCVGFYSSRVLYRIPRPPFPLPDSRSDSREDVYQFPNVGMHAGWYALGILERQIVLRDRLVGRDGSEVTLLSGAVVVGEAEVVSHISIPFGGGGLA